MTDQALTSQERTDLLDALTMHRHLLRRTADGLSDEQARFCSTPSELSIGGIIKHVADTEAEWADFMANGAPIPSPDWSNPDPAVIEARKAGFQLLLHETLDSVLADYEQIAAATDRLVTECDDLSRSFLLPEAPWFPPGSAWTVRRTVLHLLAETAQHAGHADIIREAIDGAKTMG